MQDKQTSKKLRMACLFVVVRTTKEPSKTMACIQPVFWQKVISLSLARVLAACQKGVKRLGVQTSLHRLISVETLTR